MSDDEKKSFIRKIPGFRSGKTWKMVLAVIGYGFLALIIGGMITGAIISLFDQQKDPKCDIIVNRDLELVPGQCVRFQVEQGPTQFTLSSDSTVTHAPTSGKFYVYENELNVGEYTHFQNQWVVSKPLEIAICNPSKYKQRIMVSVLIKRCNFPPEGFVYMY